MYTDNKHEELSEVEKTKLLINTGNWWSVVDYFDDQIVLREGTKGSDLG